MKLLQTIPRSNGQELRISIEPVRDQPELEYLDIRLWFSEGHGKHKKEYRTKCGFTIGPKRLEAVRAALDQAIEYFEEKKKQAQDQAAIPAQEAQKEDSAA